MRTTAGLLEAFSIFVTVLVDSGFHVTRAVHLRAPVVLRHL